MDVGSGRHMLPKGTSEISLSVRRLAQWNQTEISWRKHSQSMRHYGFVNCDAYDALDAFEDALDAFDALVQRELPHALQVSFGRNIVPLRIAVGMSVGFAFGPRCCCWPSSDRPIASPWRRP